MQGKVDVGEVHLIAEEAERRLQENTLNSSARYTFTQIHREINTQTNGTNPSSLP